MGPKPNTNLVSCLFDHCPGRLVTYGEDLLVGLNPLVPDIFLESFSHFLWDKDMFSLFAAFGVPKRQIPVVDSMGLSFKTSPTLIPPRAISSRMR